MKELFEKYYIFDDFGKIFFKNVFRTFSCFFFASLIRIRVAKNVQIRNTAKGRGDIQAKTTKPDFGFLNVNTPGKAYTEVKNFNLIVRKYNVCKKNKKNL